MAKTREISHDWNPVEVTAVMAAVAKQIKRQVKGGFSHPAIADEVRRRTKHLQLLQVVIPDSDDEAANERAQAKRCADLERRRFEILYGLDWKLITKVMNDHSPIKKVNS